MSLCLLTEDTFCAFQDPATEAPCASGMACDDANSHLCISVAQVRSCVGMDEGARCQLPGFSPTAPLECRSGVCVVPSCGDGMMFGVEECDGTDLGGATCESLGYTFGKLSCTASCVLDVRACRQAVEIPAGSFTMGSPVGEAGRNPDETQHEVTLSRGFLLQTTEVTQAQFEAVMGYNPSVGSECGPEGPVDSVSWHEAAAFTNRLSLAAGLTPCYACDTPLPGSEPDVQCAPNMEFTTPYECPGWRLPTEAEWEYAARAGDPRATYGGELDNLDCGAPHPVLDPIGWFCGNGSGFSHPTAQLQANAWGLYDMLGNVWEWVDDWYQETLSGPVEDPYVSAGEYHLPRGGGFGNFAKLLRAACRAPVFTNAPPVRNYYVGTRPARSLPPE